MLELVNDPAQGKGARPRGGSIGEGGTGGQPFGGSAKEPSFRIFCPFIPVMEGIAMIQIIS